MKKAMSPGVSFSLMSAKRRCMEAPRGRGVKIFRIALFEKESKVHTSFSPGGYTIDITGLCPKPARPDA